MISEERIKQLIKEDDAKLCERIKAQNKKYDLIITANEMFCQTDSKGNFLIRED